MLDAQMKRGLLENCVLAALARGGIQGVQMDSVEACRGRRTFPVHEGYRPCGRLPRMGVE